MHWRSVLLLSCCLLGSRTVLGGTRVVPTQYATIQAAVDASAPGDTVLVHPGVYLENPIIAVDLVLKSFAGPEQTIIDGSGEDITTLRVFSPGPGTVIDGFTIRGGSGLTRPFGRLGGGIYVGSGSYPGPLLRNNWITDNRLEPGPLAGGGGAGVCVASVARLTDNKIYANSIESLNGSGVGIYQMSQGSELVLERNEIFANTFLTTASNSGGGIYAYTAVMRENLIVCNWAKHAAGALIGSASGPSSLIEGNTFVVNRSLSDPPTATVVLSPGAGQTLAFRNNCITDNDGYGLECVFSPGTIALECNNLAGNTPANIIGTCEDAIGVEGNISEDPLYGIGGCYDLPFGSFCLLPGSPLLPENSPPGCGLIGAVGPCPLIGINDAGSLSAPLRLTAFPSPFRSSISIELAMEHADTIEIAVFDPQGRRVATVVACAGSPGAHRWQWSGVDAEGHAVPPGVYFLRARVGRRESVLPVVRVR